MNKSPLKRKALVLVTVAAFAVAVYAGGMSGAIFTTDSVGAPVDQNIYDNQNQVYISGGPNNAHGPALPANEVFYFEVTDPSGNTLLSQDAAVCRQVQTDSNGRIFQAVGGCPHNTGLVDANGSLPVRLMPFAQTPNNGGEYKVTLVRKNAAGVTVGDDGLTLDYPKSASKSDNYKVLHYWFID